MLRSPKHYKTAWLWLQAWRREEGRFRRDYNDKLFNGLVVFALADILLFRFVVRISLAETAGWIGFVFLQARLLQSPALLSCRLHINLGPSPCHMYPLRNRCIRSCT